MTTHNLQLASRPFESIRSGKKVVESRLNDEKRKLIQIGDEIVFTNREKSEATIRVIVIELLHYNSFHEMFADNDPKLFGADNPEFLEQQIKEFYSDEDEKRYGVLGIRFELAT